MIAFSRKVLFPKTYFGQEWSRIRYCIVHFVNLTHATKAYEAKSILPRFSKSSWRERYLPALLEEYGNPG
jgi:hypothetical protein